MYMVGVRVWSVVQNHCLSKVPLKYTQVLDIVPQNTGTVLLIQTVSIKGKKIQIKKKEINAHFKYIQISTEIWSSNHSNQIILSACLW